MSREHEVYNYDTDQWETIDDSWDPSPPRSTFTGPDPYTDPRGSQVPWPFPDWDGTITTNPVGSVPSLDPTRPTPTKRTTADEDGQYHTGGNYPPTTTGNYNNYGGGFSFSRLPYANIGAPPQFPNVEGVSYKAFDAPAPFKAPTAADMLVDPGYEIRRQAGEDALKRNAAALGKLRTGGTQKGLVNYNQNFASQEYGSVYDRAAHEYDRVYNNLVGEYRLGYQQALDQSNQRFRLAEDQFAPQMEYWKATSAAQQRAAELEYLREMDVFKTIYGAGND